MKPLKNTRLAYGLVAILLHWSMALLIVGMLILGLYMVRMPISLEKLKFYGWHKEVGVLILGLAILRIIWWLYNVLPALPSEMPRLEKWAARSVHLIFYGFVIVMPLTGWMMSSAAGLSVSFFGLFLLPNLVAPNPTLMSILLEVHRYLAYSLIALLVLHTLAALKHHFINKDDVLRKMI